MVSMPVGEQHMGKSDTTSFERCVEEFRIFRFTA
jgi:hypothetical protein